MDVGPTRFTQKSHTKILLQNKHETKKNSSEKVGDYMCKKVGMDHDGGNCGEVAICHEQ